MTRSGLQAEISALLTTSMQSGSGQIIVLEGEAGIGKTTIASALADEARGLGADVWLAAAAELDQANPYSVLASVASGSTYLMGTRGLRHDHPALGAAGLSAAPEVQRFTVVESVIEAVEERCQDPALFILEDLHWADSASLEAIALTARIAMSHPLILVLTHRSAHQNDALDRLAHDIAELGAHRVVVEPLSEDEVDALVWRLCGGQPSTALLSRIRGASGNPFLLREFVDGLLAEGSLIATADEVSVAPGDVPQQLQEAIGRQIRRLDADVASVVRALAVMGTVVDVTDLAAVMEQSPMALAAPIDAAVQAEILTERDEALVFRHDLVREAVYRQMPAAVRTASHRRIANVLAAQGVPAALVGTHLLLAGGGKDAETLALLHRAVAETVPIAPDAALDFLDRARSLAGNDIDARIVIERARLDAFTGVGRLQEAEDVAHWLLGVCSDNERAELRSRLAGLAIIAGDGSRALTLLDQAIADAASDLDRSPILGLAAITSATEGDYDRARELSTECIELGRRCHEPVGESIGLALVARMSTYDNSIEDGLRMGATAVAIADGDPTGTAHAYVPCLHYGMTAFDADRLDVAEQMAAHGDDLAEAHQMAWSLPLFGSLAAACWFRRGQLDRAAAEAEASVELSDRTSSRQTLMWSQAVLSLVAVELGDVAEAVRWADAAAESFATGVSSLGVDHMVLAQVRAAELAGDVDGAYDGLVSAWDLFEDNGLTFCHPLIAWDLARLALSRDDVTMVDRVIASVQTAADANDVPAIVANAEFIAAVRAEDAVGARSAVARLRSTERHLELAHWLAADPDLLGFDDDGVAALHESLEIFDRLGATYSAGRVRGQLAALGAEVPGEASSWDLLTPTELDIARLLADGSTNAEIARLRGGSRRTVESHLRRIYRKLDIDGRVKLTLAAIDHFRPPG